LADKNVQKIDSTGLRYRAEEQLRDETTSEHLLGTEGDPLKLLYELQVHQVELEMQNAELRQARDKLESALEQYTDLYDFAPVGYLTLDREGTISRVNFKAAGFLGVDRSRLVGRRFESSVGGEERPAFAAFLGRVFASLSKETCEVTLMKEGNSPLFVEIEAEAAASGQECRIVLFDLTESILVKKLIRDTEETSNEALRKVANSVDLAIKKVQEAAEKALQKAEELPETLETIELAHLMVEEASEEARLMVAKEAEIARLKVVEIACKHQLNEEAMGHVFQKLKEAAEIAKLKVEKAAEVARRVVLVEVANNVLRQKRELAEAATRGKSQFLANMSHELRTPMTGVLGMLDLVLLGNLEAEQREFIDAAHSSARSLVLILNDILDMTKIEMGKFSIEAKPFSLRKCVESTFNILFPAAKSKGINFTLTVADNVPETLVGDQIRLNQVLTNLAGNAVKFTTQGKVEICVVAGGSALDGKREVTFTVTDTGIGIPADKMNLLFQAFSQVDQSHNRSQGGTGLGLAISKEIVESMGGTINFTSEEGKGSVFTFTIPFVEGEAERIAGFAPGKTATTNEAFRAEETHKVHILVAEDDNTIRQVLGKMLKLSGYETDFAENGQLVVEMWEKGQYDLILMDVQMPLMNGFEATDAIREKERTRGGHIPIVAMTAHALKKDEEKCLDGGMDAYISKPIDFKNTLQVIRETLKL
jgi:signal transduction histidine kinase/PAS domain-containing protein/ActR/RegA family two-component response regulator